MSRGKMFIAMVVALGLAVASSANARSSYYIGFNSGPSFVALAYPVYPVIAPLHHRFITRVRFMHILLQLFQDQVSLLDSPADYKT